MGFFVCLMIDISLLLDWSFCTHLVVYSIAILANVCQVAAVVVETGRRRGWRWWRWFVFRFHYVRVHKRMSFKLTTAIYYESPVSMYIILNRYNRSGNCKIHHLKMQPHVCKALYLFRDG